MKLARLWLYLIYVYFVLVNHSNSRCLDVQNDIPERQFRYNNEPLDITLQYSNGISQQIITHILKIYLEDYLKFSGVTIVDTTSNAINVTTLVSPLDPVRVVESALLDTNCSRHIIRCMLEVPVAMINLEVWKPPGYDLSTTLSNYQFIDVGSVGVGGSVSWYIYGQFPKYPIYEHWKVYQNRTAASSLYIPLSVYRDLLFNEKLSRYYCGNSDNCIQGRFEPEICRGHHSDPSHRCAILFTSYPEIFNFVKDHIVDLNLYVEVAFIGHNLDTFIRNCTVRKQPVMLLTFSTDYVLKLGKFTPVSFSPCVEYENMTDPGCAYQFRVFHKMIWDGIQIGSNELHETVSRMSFTHQDYDGLLRMYSKTSQRLSTDFIACTWMKKNKRVWKKWSNSNRRKLYLGGIFPIFSKVYGASGIVPAALMAIDAVNENSSVLPKYSLELKVFDGQCKPDMVMKSFIDFLLFKEFNLMAGILGPACSDTVEPIAGVSKHYRTAVISYSAEGASFSDRDKYPYFFRTIGENKQFRFVYLQLFKAFNWRRVASLTEEGSKYSEYLSDLQDLLQNNQIAFVMNRKIPRGHEITHMTQYLDSLRKKSARIIIADLYEHLAASLMCEAYKKNMTGKFGYVWFLPSWFRRSWHDTISRHERNISCSDDELISAVEGSLSLSHSAFAEDDTVMQENITVGEWKQKYLAHINKIQSSTMNNSGRVPTIEFSEYSGYAYDAVWTYAYALDKFFKDGRSHIGGFHNEDSITHLVKYLNETDFQGVSGHVSFVGPSRVTKINIFQLFNKTFHLVGIFHPNVSSSLGGRLYLMNPDFVWFTKDGKPPSDGSEPPIQCVLEGLSKVLNVNCEEAIVIANIIGFGLFAIVLISCFMIFKRRFEKRVQLTEERMKALGLTSQSNMLTLDDWEIPRSRVVINRKLGEGAFGTVYGGEALLDEKGWVAVAVKTLKIGSTIEETLDFLSEADMMKRFNHRNIVQLLGVCTTQEPVYTVMEFMLYGDLKTYLLARRHLVNEKSREEYDEVSNRRLTSMALDVARAVSYLAELKYVHRDVACRNCLVNANRVVKLADFGMTRPMYDKDYYKFNRKGMLPVRWMAPESLADGIFTPMTDIWSYGVLLYEIITFGSFPFQGLSNNQVLEYVKAGNTVALPKGIKSQLETLLHSCWDIVPTKRPQASEIMDLLNNNSRLISPCIDVPLASVQMEGSDSLEIQIPERNRKYSYTRKSNASLSHKPDRSDGTSSVSDGIPDSGVFSLTKVPLMSHKTNHNSRYITIHNQKDCDGRNVIDQTSL